MKVIMMMMMVMLLLCKRQRGVAATKQNGEARKRQMREQCQVSGGYSTSATAALHCVLFSHTFEVELWATININLPQVHQLKPLL